MDIPIRCPITHSWTGTIPAKPWKSQTLFCKLLPQPTSRSEQSIFVASSSWVRPSWRRKSRFFCPLAYFEPWFEFPDDLISLVPIRMLLMNYIRTAEGTQGRPDCIADRNKSTNNKFVRQQTSGFENLYSTGKDTHQKTRENQFWMMGRFFSGPRGYEWVTIQSIKAFPNFRIGHHFRGPNFYHEATRTKLPPRQIGRIKICFLGNI